MDYLAKRDLEVSNISNLPAERQQNIIQLKNNIVMSHESIVEFGTKASKQLTTFSNDLLKSVKLKDTPEVEGMITELLGGLNEVDTDSLLATKPNVFHKLFKVDKLKNFVVKYENVSEVIGQVKTKLEGSQYQLKKDIELCTKYLEQNMLYINDLDDHILAGNLKINEEAARLEEVEKTIDKNDMLAVQTFAMQKDDLSRLERKVHDLLLMREIAIQNIPQIMLIRSGDSVLIEKIDSSINSAIPLWESQMVISIELMRQQNALKVQKAVTDTTNKLLERNSELLKSGSIGIAKELERGIVDVETLRKNSENLITTLTEIKKIKQEGQKTRELVAGELIKINERLHQNLLES